MRKLAVWACLLAVGLAVFPFASQAKVDRKPGDIPAFIVGCCWGIREGTEWNEGADLHWREWMRVVPFVNIVIMIWDGKECYDGITARDWAKKNGANWY